MYSEYFLSLLKSVHGRLPARLKFGVLEIRYVPPQGSVHLPSSGIGSGEGQKPPKWVDEKQIVQKLMFHALLFAKFAHLKPLNSGSTPPPLHHQKSSGKKCLHILMHSPTTLP